MSIVILDREGNNKRPYLEWLGNLKLEDKLYIIGYEETSNSFNYKNSIGFYNFESNLAVESFIFKLHRTDPIKHLFAFEEGTIIRAAVIRERLNINGQSVSSAIQYRDKYIMKKVLNKSGIGVPNFRKINHFMDIITFIDEYGFPCILKPRLKWASKGIIKLNSYQDVFMLEGEDILSDYMIEKYVKGRLFHVDGLRTSDKMYFSCISEYIENCFDSFSKNEGLTTVMIDEDSQLWNPLKNYVETIFSILETPSNCPFHAEIFLEESTNDLLLCEIASRSIGGDFTKNIERTYGVNLDKFYLLGELDRLEHTLKPKGMRTGKIWISPQWGFIDSIPECYHIKGVYDCICNETNFRYFRGLQKQMDSLLTVCFEAKDYNSLKKKASEIKTFYSNLDWNTHI